MLKHKKYYNLFFLIIALTFSVIILTIYHVRWFTRYQRIKSALNSEIFQRVFGETVSIDQKIIKYAFKKDNKDKLYFDFNKDGRPEEVWFYEKAKIKKHSPLLVRAIDEDGDLSFGGKPDLDSDLYIADWKSDGEIDAIVDYNDLDGDQDVDEKCLYTRYGPSKVLCIYSQDVSDDNKLIFDIDYMYDQELCQWKSHFNGSEYFCFFEAADNKQWKTIWESPFAFYDDDGDGISEEAVRIECENQRVWNIRYSMDADDDATLEKNKDYDFSIKAYASKDGLPFPDSLGEKLILRCIPTDLFLKYEKVREFIINQVYENIMLTWDENDHNVDPKENPMEERWEGVIGEDNEFFKGPGAPQSGKYNKRFEVINEPNHTFSLYYHPSDRRFHLLNAKKMWIETDMDFNKKPEMHIEYLDSDSNGIIDRCLIDINMDGHSDDEYSLTQTDIYPVRWDWFEISTIYRQMLSITNVELLSLNLRLKQALEKLGIDISKDDICKLINTNLKNKNIPNWLRDKLLTSNEARRYYNEVLKDRLIWSLKKINKNEQFWHNFNKYRESGDFNGMRDLLEDEFNLKEK